MEFIESMLTIVGFWLVKQLEKPRQPLIIGRAVTVSVSHSGVLKLVRRNPDQALTKEGNADISIGL